ncbi:MAG: hypothetical protein HZC42_03365 [Candidatus Eisenbacteria bacterium]|nr:hypothetical protein [Candidatus Eisenbacteria bacterium]
MTVALRGTGASPTSAGARLLFVTVFAAAMGWLEGVVVVYIRGLLGIAHTDVMPDSAEMMRRMSALAWLLPTEQTREAATLIILAAVAALAAPRLRARFGAFLVAFGIWDITYYVALYALLRWPPGLTTMDLLFLLPPHPWWYQPVWVPIAISCGMIGVGVRLFTATARER